MGLLAAVSCGENGGRGDSGEGGCSAVIVLSCFDEFLEEYKVFMERIQWSYATSGKVSDWNRIPGSRAVVDV